MKWRPFIEWRPEEIGIGISLSVDRIHNYELDKTTAPETLLRPAHVWCPNIWIHIGPVSTGIGWESR